MLPYKAYMDPMGYDELLRNFISIFAAKKHVGWSSKLIRKVVASGNIDPEILD